MLIFKCYLVALCKFSKFLMIFWRSFLLEHYFPKDLTYSAKRSNKYFSQKAKWKFGYWNCKTSLVLARTNFYIKAFFNFYHIESNIKWHRLNARFDNLAWRENWVKLKQKLKAEKVVTVSYFSNHFNYQNTFFILYTLYTVQVLQKNFFILLLLGSCYLCW